MNAAFVDTPVGRLRIVAAGAAVTAVSWCDALRGGGAVDGVLADAVAQISAWFAGRLETFSLPLAPAGTPFQRRVWRALEAVPYGRTRTYGDVARDVGSAPRAVGRACGANPIPIVVPCHRIVAAGGGLGGYSGAGGGDTKRRLLAFEAARMRWPASAAAGRNQS